MDKTDIKGLIYGSVYQQRKGIGQKFEDYEEKSNSCYYVGVGGCKSIRADHQSFSKRTNQPPSLYHVSFKDGSHTVIHFDQVLKVLH